MAWKSADSSIRSVLPRVRTRSSLQQGRTDIELRTSGSDLVFKFNIVEKQRQFICLTNRTAGAVLKVASQIFQISKSISAPGHLQRRGHMLFDYPLPVLASKVLQQFLSQIHHVSDFFSVLGVIGMYNLA
ncbi:hypothetical protein CCGE531_26415 (plasmid) [Rhizobium sp. CCGE531]|nr:hypothetical protein CCGE531_26415 [Rhizobium sp. CCGE531]AYG76048.1 hypothetical protein CCGE532_25900 [Rhizobium sp. CCGE532]